MKKSRLIFSLVAFVSMVLLSACNQLVIDAPQENVELISIGFEASPLDGTLQVVNIDGRDVSGLSTQATLSGTELAFEFANPSFPTAGEMTVDFKFDNKAANGWQNVKVIRTAGPDGALADATGAEYAYSIDGNSGKLDITTEGFTGTAMAADTGNDDFVGPDAFTLAFEVDFTPGARFEFYINVTAEAIPANVVAFDLVGGASFNRTSRILAPATAEPGLPALPADNFGAQFTKADVTAGGLNPNDPLSMLVDVNQVFEPFFLVRDLTTSIVPSTASPATATWAFDINGYTDLQISIDFAAFGDFSASNDVFTLTYQIDGGIVETAFTIVVDEALSADYTPINGGLINTLNDPITISNGSAAVVQDNTFDTFTKAITGLTGTESTLKLVFSAATSSGPDYLGFRNIIITGN